MQEKQSQYFIPLAIIIAGGFIAFAIYLNKTPQPSTNPTAANVANQQAPAAVDIKNVSFGADPYIGDKNAPVTFALWTDFQCPFCKRFEISSAGASAPLDDLIKNYVKTGKIKIVFKDYQFLGPDSMTEAVFARAVWDLYPDKYFAWRTAVFTAQDGENSGFGDEKSVVALTKTVSGIDTSKIEQAISQKKDAYQQAIAADLSEGNKFGVNGTPAFIIGKQLFSGGMAYADLAKLIDAQLK